MKHTAIYIRKSSNQTVSERRLSLVWMIAVMLNTWTQRSNCRLASST